MKVLLKENIENLGKKGDIVNTAPGYARNYLLPKQMAVKVTPANSKMIEMLQQSLRKGLAQEMKSYQAQVEQLSAVALTFVRKAGDKDSIFGSVSTTDIKEALADLNFEVEKKKILLEEPIKKLGNYVVPIKIFHDEKAEIKIEVIREGDLKGKEPEVPEEPEVSKEEPDTKAEDAPKELEATPVEDAPEEPEEPPAEEPEEPETAEKAEEKT